MSCPVFNQFCNIYLGCGCDNCATVSLAWHRPTEQHVAVKRINLEQCEMDFNTIQVQFY